MKTKKKEEHKNWMRKHHITQMENIQKNMFIKNLTPNQWAKAKKFNVDLTYKILRGDVLGRFGISADIKRELFKDFSNEQ